METIQVVLDAALLRPTDRAARRFKVNRSALVRDALRAHFAALAHRERETGRSTGLLTNTPDRDSAGWDKVAAWPGGD